MGCFNDIHQMMRDFTLAATCGLMIAALAVACANEAPSPTPVLSPTPSPIISPLPLTATPIEQGEVGRPILYVGEERSGRLRMTVTDAVYPGGRQVGTVVRTVGATWSPQGTQIAFVTPAGSSLRVADLQGEDRTIINASSVWRPYYAWPTWSPDGTKIALVEVGWCEVGNRIVDIVVVEAATGKVVSRHGPHDFWMAHGTENGPGAFSMPEALRWSPDGTKFLISWDNASVLDFSTGEIERVSDTRVIAEWAPRGDAVYYFETTKPKRSRKGRALSAFNVKSLGSDSSRVLANEEKLASLGMTQVGGRHPGLLVLSPEGSALAVSTGQDPGGTSRLRLFDLEAGEAIALESPSQSFQAGGRIVAMDWSPDEKSIAALVVDEADSATLQVLDREAGTWKTVATPTIDVDVIDDIPVGLSWGR